MLARTVVPYFNVTWFYDTRYDDWARTLYTAGAGITLNQHVSHEVYLAYQHHSQPIDESLNALGLVARWYC